MIAPIRVLVAAALFGLAAGALAQTPEPGSDASITASQDAADALTGEQRERYDALTHQLRCLVCQNQTIADSAAPLALDLREQVARQIGQGRSDREIRGYLTDRYGDFVLYRPPFAARTLVLWLGPFALLLIALASAIVFMRGSRRRAGARPVADRARLQALLQDEDRGS